MKPLLVMTKVLSFGEGMFGSLGHGSYTSLTIPTRIKTFSDCTRIVSVHSGWGSSMAMNESGELYEWGWPRDFRGLSRMIGMRKVVSRLIPFLQRRRWLGLAGFQHATLVPTPIVGLEGLRVTNCDSGIAFSAAVTQEGKVYAWGDTLHGQFGSELAEVNSFPPLVGPTALEYYDDKDIVKVVCGNTHLFCISRAGEVYASGRVVAGLGVGFREESRVKGDKAGAKGKKTQVFNLRECHSEDSMPGEFMGPVVDAAGGFHSSIFLNDKGKVFTCGRGGVGVLGYLSENDVSFPKPLDTFDGEKCIQVAAGMNHMAVLTESKRVFTWGLGENGQCAREFSDGVTVKAPSGVNYQVFAPEPIQFPEGFTPRKIVLGVGCTMVVGEDNRLLMYGELPNEQLHYTDETDENVHGSFREICKDESVLDVSVGWAHVLVVAE